MTYGVGTNQFRQTGKRKVRPQNRTITFLTVYGILLCSMLLVASIFRITHKSSNSGIVAAVRADGGKLGVEQTATPSAQLAVDDPIAKTKWEEFVFAARKVAKMYNFPVNVVLAQGALESGHGTSSFCKTRNNCLGIGAVDWDPNQAFVFENMEQSIVEYMRLIRKNFPEAWRSRNNPDMVIYHLKYNKDGLVYATDPNYVSKVKSLPEFQEK